MFVPSSRIAYTISSGLTATKSSYGEHNMIKTTPWSVVNYTLNNKQETLPKYNLYEERKGSLPTSKL